METNNEPYRPHLSHYPKAADYDDFLHGLILGWGTDPLPEVEPEVTDQDDMKEGGW